jgi:hypothetical protein
VRRDAVHPGHTGMIRFQEKKMRKVHNSMRERVDPHSKFRFIRFLPQAAI